MGIPANQGKETFVSPTSMGSLSTPRALRIRWPFAATISLRFCRAVSEKKAGGHGDAQPVHLGGGRLHGFGCFDRLRFGFKAPAVQRFDEVFDFLTVGSVIEGDAAVAVDGEVVHLIGKAGCTQVFGRGTGDFADGVHQPLAIGAGQIISQCH